jgi:hypothetical protein
MIVTTAVSAVVLASAISPKITFAILAEDRKPNLDALRVPLDER